MKNEQTDEWTECQTIQILYSPPPLFQSGAIKMFCHINFHPDLPMLTLNILTDTKQISDVKITGQHPGHFYQIENLIFKF